MRRNKVIGVLMILMGVLVLLYKNDGFYGWGRYIDKSWENIIISTVIIVIGVLFIKKGKKNQKAR
ncbi:hypothetical protein [Aquimarina macrocephali]|uniref:hypothetical protein n=1 Tax=Aquimarina macrocephali TaxID=666563 RepID=UPI0004661424|nr:hypothetical protein [Aquimarina macrocephali]